MFSKAKSGRSNWLVWFFFSLYQILRNMSSEPVWIVVDLSFKYQFFCEISRNRYSYLANRVGDAFLVRKNPSKKCLAQWPEFWSTVLPRIHRASASDGGHPFLDHVLFGLVMDFWGRQRSYWLGSSVCGWIFKSTSFLWDLVFLVFPSY